MGRARHDSERLQGLLALDIGAADCGGLDSPTSRRYDVRAATVSQGYDDRQRPGVVKRRQASGAGWVRGRGGGGGLGNQSRQEDPSQRPNDERDFRHRGDAGETRFLIAIH